ncbi:MAG: hypothetical protein IPH65_17555 [Dehalococcoidia bacterium]|uniref:hypothetical protein n=1 Tax=Candidatus Amarobacter glycogenicus TaxID=3140699 RepID=UPI0031355B53|nr:hypothetical protein [Dehalococcoidia bacterium]
MSTRPSGASFGLSREQRGDEGRVDARPNFRRGLGNLVRPISRQAARAGTACSASAASDPVLAGEGRAASGGTRTTASAATVASGGAEAARASPRYSDSFHTATAEHFRAGGQRARFDAVDEGLPAPIDVEHRAGATVQLARHRRPVTSGGIGVVEKTDERRDVVTGGRLREAGIETLADGAVAGGITRRSARASAGFLSKGHRTPKRRSAASISAEVGRV